MKPDYQVGIIGAGFAGIIAALNLKKSGRNSFVIFERAKEVGGTWRDNVYPGCACDVPSPLYSISTEPNPDWPRLFSSQPQILEYLINVVNRNDLRKHIQFESDIVEQEFIEAEGLWKITDRKGRVTHVKMMIMAPGPLNRVKFPNIKGIETFKGKHFHSAEWDTTYSLKGKRVAVIGTGASAVQIVPNIADEVADMTVFQRTAAWIGTRFDRPFSKEQKEKFRNRPFSQKLMREFIYWFLEFRGLMMVGNKRVHNFFTKQSLKKLEKEVKDPEVRKKLTPDYALGCKRILVSDDYWPTFNRPNVHLVTDSITEIKEHSIVTADGKEHEVDAIIFSTGFEAAEIHTDAKLYGLNKRELFTEWLEKGLNAFHGTTVSGYPNLAFVLGPNTGLGHNSVVHMMESQMPYIMQYLEMIEKKGEKAYLDVKSEAQEAYNAKLQSKFKGTVWQTGCKSWYLNSQGKNTTLYPRLTLTYRREMKKLDKNNYRVATA
jgi:cation diffusion facilitator CzcD-associated flavoprotein CzcO